MPRLSVLLAALLLAPAALPQDADPAATGLAALDAAARWQRGETPRAAPSTLHGKFHLSYRDEQGNLVQAEVERWYTRDPERLLTRTTESITGLTTTEAWNGTTGWFRDDKKGFVVDYGADPENHEVDLRKMQDQLRLTRLLLDALALDALRPRLSDVRVVGHEMLTDIDHNTHDVSLVQASAPDELSPPVQAATPTAEPAPAARLRLVLGIDAKDGTLWSMQVQSPGRPDYAVRFDLHAKTSDGLRVPGNIRVYEAGSRRPANELSVHLDEEDHIQLQLDGAVDAAMFAMPAAAGS